MVPFRGWVGRGSPETMSSQNVLGRTGYTKRDGQYGETLTTGKQ